MLINKKPQSRNGTVATMMRGRNIHQGTHMRMSTESQITCQVCKLTYRQRNPSKEHEER